MHVGILSTGPVMASGLYGKLEMIKVAVLDEPDLHCVHKAYVTLAESGQATPEMQETFLSAARALQAKGAQAILLGGTDLAPRFAQPQPPFPILDCAQIHIEAIANDALTTGADALPRRNRPLS